ncbi:MAG: acyl-CoA mutase large subunit family protein, partial [Verrucomicrobia bacterium]|nr:acyl-CoA mutase large subunit family protein [Verrucomicrobiota bacterium]
MKSAAPDETLSTALAQWRKTVESELKGVPFEKKLVTRTPEGAALQPLYTRLDLAAVPDLAARPGAAPYLRGTYTVGARDRSWETCQEIPAATPAEFNRALLGALMQGQNSVSLTPDAATLAGRDPATTEADAVGAGGVSLADATDLARALEKVAIDCVPVHLATGAVAGPLAALYLAAVTARAIPYEKLTGSVTADPLGEWVRRGRLASPLAGQFDELAAWTTWAAKNAPALRTVGVSTVTWSDAGATATQELAFALAAGVEYLRALTARSVPAATAAARMRFTFAVGSQFFSEVAKFRAFRLLWVRALTAFGAGGAAKALVVHARTGRWNKTVHDMHVNMLRVTTEACSAVLGGVDSLHVSPYDEIGGAPDEISQRIARNVHTLLAEEFHFKDTADPAGGSWYVEKLTDDFARRAWKQFQEIEAAGGYATALRAGLPQKLVAASAAEKDDAIGKRRTGLIGTNLFPNLREKIPTVKSRDTVALALARSREIAARRGTAPTVAPGMDGAIRAAAAGAT